MSEYKKKRFILLMFISLMTIPLFLTVLPFKLAGRVHRSELVHESKQLTIKSWLDESFQNSLTEYLNDNFGLFPFFIRVHNQLEFSLFNVAHTGNIIKGKDNYLFDKLYIDPYYGKDFIGHKEVNTKTKQLKSLQDSLKKSGKLLLFCVATDKCHYYPELMPHLGEKQTSNYEAFIPEFNKYNINYIDATPWFLDMKDSLGYLLYPKYGVHWSHYSAMLMTDSIIDYINNKKQWQLPSFKIKEEVYSDKAKYYDNDIVQSMNLFIDAQPEPMIYPTTRWESSDDATKGKKLLIIGDSFSWDILENTGIEEGCFEKVRFFYYNQLLYTANRDKGLPKLTRHYRTSKMLEEYDVFLIIASVPNIRNTGWGFVEDALTAMKDSTYKPKGRNNDFLETESRNKTEWREDLELLAKKRDITLDSMINVYLLDKNYN